MDNKMDINEQYFKDEIWSYFHYIKKLMYTLTLDGMLTDDLTQDTMLLCWKKIETVKRYKNMKFALATIARNEYRRFCRSSKDDFFDLVDLENLCWIMSPSDIEDYIRREGDVHELLLLFSGIKREYVQVVLLADYYEISLKDIAKLLNKKYNTIVSHHARGLEELRKHKDLLRMLLSNTDACSIAVDRFLGNEYDLSSY